MEPPQSLQVLRVNHRDKLTDALEAMFYEESLCDVTICCSGQQVKAHRVILAACSQYFKQIFSSTVAGQYPIVFIKAITIEDLNAILEFAYKGEVTVPHAQIESLIGSAETLGVTGLGKINLHEQDFMINGQVSPRVNGNGNSSASSSPSHGSETNGNYISRQTSSRRETRNAQYQPAQVEIQKNVSIQPLPKKRGKKRKIRDEQPKVEEQIVKAPIAPTRSTPSTSKSSSRESSLGRSSSKHTKSIPPVAHAPHFNGRHKMAPPPPPVIPSSPTTQHEMTDQDIENVEDVELDLPSYTRADEFEDGHRVIPLDEDEDEQEDRASAQTISDSLSSSPDAQAAVSVESPTEQPNITSNGSLDLSQHSTRSDSHETPNKTITKSKLRSWSQQISQSVSTGSTPPPSILTRPSINLAAIKSEINEQLQQGVAAATASTSAISSPATSISTSASVSSSNVISAPSTSSVHIEPQQQQQHHHQQQRQQQQKQPTPSIKQQQQPSPKPSVIKSAPVRPVVNQQPEEEDVKPVLPFTIPPYIKMEARPRGRPRKSVTANAAVVPRPLNPLLGLARSSLAGKIAAAAAGSPSSPIPPTGSPTPQALMTPPPPPPPQTQQQQAHIIPTTPTVPPLRISPKASPSSTPTVTIVNSNGTPIATASANSGIMASPQLDPSTPTVVVKKRRGRPPSSSLVNRESPGSSSSQVKPKTELKVPTLTLKLQQPLTHYLKARTSDSHSHMTSSSSTSSSSSSTPSASFVTTIQSPHIPNTFNTSPITTTTQTAHHHHHHNNNPQMQHNNQQTEYAQSHQPSQQPLLTITTGSIPPSATIPVPRFTPILPPTPNEAQQQQYQHQQQQQQNPGQH